MLTALVNQAQAYLSSYSHHAIRFVFRLQYDIAPNSVPPTLERRFIPSVDAIQAHFGGRMCDVHANDTNIVGSSTIGAR